ncbi:MAG: Phenylacetate-coenzyme ligase [Firmicutes bacterium]|nr:Phenylacetate-coenzyme ligase [Bacillota bacterium]
MQLKLAILDLVSGLKVYKFYSELNKSQWMTASELRQMQNEKLKTLLNYAYNNVPYYRSILPKEGSIKTNALDMLKDLPLLSRRLLQEKVQELCDETKSLKKMRLVSTSGTTGSVVKVYIDDCAITYSRALEKRGEYEWTGTNFFAKRVFFSTNKQDKRNFIRKLVNFIRSRWRYCLVEKEKRRYIKNEKLKLYIDEIITIQPQVVRGLASCLRHVAEYLQENDIKQIRPNAVISNSEPLTIKSKKLIEEAFGARVYNQYGLSECGTVASECPHGQMHINAERFIVEIVKDGEVVAPGMEGEIVITDLHNYGFPLIRYGTKDLGILDSNLCSCGRELPVLQKIVGRTVEIIHTPSGDSVPATQIDHIFGEIPYAQIRQVQLYQPSIDKLVVRLIKGHEYSEDSGSKAKSLIEPYFKDTGVELSLEFCDIIPTTKSGKMQFYLRGYNANNG